MHPVQKIIKSRAQDPCQGIASYCTSNETVLRAVLELCARLDTFALIEATANQVNQSGGYTGMTPAQYHAFVTKLARESGLKADKLILGGDHLGPLTYCYLPEDEAMRLSKELVRDYVLAGFTKIHLDTSMKLAVDTGSLGDDVIARRGAQLCAAAEEAFAQYKKQHPGALPPVYIIGSEVPIPGGAQESEDGIAVTGSQAAKDTLRHYYEEFTRNNLPFDRVIALVVQPGVEFSENRVFTYDPHKAEELKNSLEHDFMAFEAHSTDYQPVYALNGLVRDGFCILKVGPALTFALREGLLALACIEDELQPLYGFQSSGFRRVLLGEMIKDDSQWKKHYHGSIEQQRFQCLFSLSDRARYYLPNPGIMAAQEKLLNNLNGLELPLTLISQYLPAQYSKIKERRLKCDADNLLKHKIQEVALQYLQATGQIHDQFQSDLLNL